MCSMAAVMKRLNGEGNGEDIFHRDKIHFDQGDETDQRYRGTWLTTNEGQSQQGWDGMKHNLRNGKIHCEQLTNESNLINMSSALLSEIHWVYFSWNRHFDFALFSLWLTVSKITHSAMQTLPLLHLSLREYGHYPFHNPLFPLPHFAINLTLEMLLYITYTYILSLWKLIRFMYE